MEVLNNSNFSNSAVFIAIHDAFHIETDTTALVQLRFWEMLFLGNL